jgi:hypothetical protein
MISSSIVILGDNIKFVKLARHGSAKANKDDRDSREIQA